MHLVSKLRKGAVRTLHAIAPLRALAKRMMRGRTVTQPFHGGVIQLDAVEHSWAWTGRLSYETFDVELQAALLRLSREHSMMLDIGCNIGAMTLTVLLRNPSIRAIAVDPNLRATELLRSSLRKNRIADRAEVIVAAVAPTAGTVHFDESGSVVGHIVERGRAVPALAFEALVRRAADPVRGCLVKIDVEGFERRLLDGAAWLSGIRGLTLVVELHPAGYNGVGDPAWTAAELRRMGATLRDVEGRPLGPIDPSAFTMAIATWE